MQAGPEAVDDPLEDIAILSLALSRLMLLPRVRASEISALS